MIRWRANAALVMMGWVLVCAARVVAQTPSASAEPAGSSDTASSPASAAFLPDPSGPFLSFEEAWPVRAGRVERDEIQGVIVPWDVSVSRLLPEFMSGAPRALSDLDIADVEALAPGSTAPVSLEGRRGLIFRLGTPEETRRKGFGRGPARAAGPDAAMVFRYVSAARGAEGDGEMAIQRTWFAYYDPMALKGSKGGSAAPPPAPRGVILLMPGLYGTPEPTFDVMVRRLRESGWGVLRMLAQPSRFTERIQLELDPGDMQASAVKVAAILCDRAGECGLAAQAAWQYLEEQRPELKDLPKAIVGTSGGGMTLPTVVARESDRYRACILIGSAADFWLIARRSTYTNDASSIDVRIKGLGSVPPEASGQFDWKHFDELYLAAAPLDSFHSAKAMHGKRVLMIHGQADTAVPASLGDVLWERLGKPERWEYPTGHEGLIIEMVPRDTGKMIAWLNEHARE